MPFLGQGQKKFKFIDQLRKFLPTSFARHHDYHGNNVAGHVKRPHFCGPRTPSCFPIVQFHTPIDALSLSQHETALLIF
jgi:hypothetical protein